MCVLACECVSMYLEHFILLQAVLTGIIKDMTPVCTICVSFLVVFSSKQAPALWLYVLGVNELTEIGLPLSALQELINGIKQHLLLHGLQPRDSDWSLWLFVLNLLPFSSITTHTLYITTFAAVGCSHQHI